MPGAKTVTFGITMMTKNAATENNDRITVAAWVGIDGAMFVRIAAPELKAVVAEPLFDRCLIHLAREKHASYSRSNIRAHEQITSPGG